MKPKFKQGNRVFVKISREKSKIRHIIHVFSKTTSFEYFYYILENQETAQESELELLGCRPDGSEFEVGDSVIIREIGEDSDIVHRVEDICFEAFYGDEGNYQMFALILDNGSMISQKDAQFVEGEIENE